MKPERVKVRSISPRFLKVGEEIELSAAEALAVVSVGSAEYVTRAPAEPELPKGRHERRDMRARS